MYVTDTEKRGDIFGLLEQESIILLKTKSYHQHKWFTLGINDD